MTTILEADLERLYQQTIMNSDYGALEKTTPQNITGNMKLGQYTIHPKTSQLEGQNLLYNGTDETQEYLYPPLQVNPHHPVYFTNFNYAYDKFITKKPIDVSGLAVPNNELRNIAGRGSDNIYRPQIIQK